MQRRLLSRNVYEICVSDIFFLIIPVFDASGQYTPNVLFGNEYWLGSLNACKDLQLKEYYTNTPPFETTFYVAKINLTVDNEHLPQVRNLSKKM